MRMVLLWSDLVRTSSRGPAVFEVQPGHRRRVRGWANAQRVATAAQRDVHMPVVEGWAVLDGGVTAVSGYGLTSLPYGVRVIGFQALRLLLDDLGVEGPEPFPGEVPIALDELRRRHRATRPDAPEAVEQAELLAVCRDAVLLRWVAKTLEASRGTIPAPRTGDRPGRTPHPDRPAVLAVRPRDAHHGAPPHSAPR